MMMLSIPICFSPPSPLRFLPQSSLLSASAAGRTTLAAHRLAAIGPDGKYYPSPVDDEPPEADEDTAHGVSKFQQIYRQASRARKLQEEQFEQDKSLFLSALAAEPEASQASQDASGDDDFFGEIDRAITLKRQDFVKQGLLKPSQEEVSVEGIDELLPEEVVDVEEIQELQGLTIIDGDADVEEEAMNLPVGDAKPGSSFATTASSSSSPPPFDLDFDSMSKTKFRVVEPKFKMTLAELLDESRVVPVSVYGNLNVTITGIQHDSREVSGGDLFVCCVGMKTDGHLYLSEADKRGAVAVVASKEINIDETLGCKALVIVEDTNAVLPILAASCPSSSPWFFRLVVRFSCSCCRQPG